SLDLLSFPTRRSSDLQLRFFVCVLLNTLVAVFLPATLQSEFHPSRFFPYSGIGLLSAPWTTSVIFAALCGLVAARLESRTAGWRSEERRVGKEFSCAC